VSPASTPAAAFVAGRYLLRERIGSGAAGEIWRAQDPRIGRRVAVKFLRIPEGLTAAQRAEWESRFLLEARAAGRLSHPGIVPVFDVGTARDGRPFIVMELVEGQSLDVIRQSGPRPPFAQIVAWIGELAEALHAAHTSGVIHRDVKPANILIGTDGRARITDFGTARVAESELTRDGTFVGSPAFAAPEQLCGAKVDGRADLFALAAVFYLVVTAKRPFVGDDIPSIVYAVCHREPDPPGISPAIDAVILRALAKSPDDRYASVREFGRALSAATADWDGGVWPL
jgi:serine/threonine-protein kinase